MNEKELENAWKNVESGIYLSQNKAKIKRYLEEKGIVVDEKVVKRFLEKQKNSSIAYKNEGKQKVRETGKSFILRPKFFAILAGDMFYIREY